MLQWARAQACGLDVQACAVEAARRGHLEVLEWLVAMQGARCDTALRQSHATVPQSRAVDVRALSRPTRHAGRGTDVEPWNPGGHHGRYRTRATSAIKHLSDSESKLLELGSAVCTAAAMGGRVEVLEWAVCQVTHEGALAAAVTAALWGQRGSTCVCTVAAVHGHMGVMVWLRQQREPPCPWHESTCSAAAAGGRLTMLKWARAQEPPCPWSSDTCWAAAAGGHLEVPHCDDIVTN